jgi:hypothetical protein
MSGLLIDRYLAGDHEAIWEDIRARNAPTPDDAEVATELMRRVAHNVDLVVSRLAGIGWRWAYPDSRRIQPTSDDLTALGQLESRLGPLPLALAACLREVGEVWLCGTLPSASPPTYAFDDLQEYPVLADPLVLPAAAWVLEELELWDKDDWITSKRPFELEFAPDELHKANISGSTHNLILPSHDVDPILSGVQGREGVTLVEYLRSSLKWGGFPGFEFVGTPPGLIAHLAKDLLEF